jgi:hypothetical protein
MKYSTIKSAIPSLLLSALVLIPFLNKAFTIDDPFFLFQARHALIDPLHPTAFEMTLHFAPERVSQLAPTGPIMAWLLVPSVLVSGTEWLAHATQLVMVWVTILSTISLARRLEIKEPWPAISGVIVVAMPTVLGMAGTAMPDVPAMALGVAGIERLVAWSQNRKVFQAVLAAVLLGLAPLARPHLIFLLGIGAILIIGPTISMDALRAKYSAYLPLIAAPIISVVVSYITRDPYPGAGSMSSSAIKYSSLSISHLASNLIALPIHWVLAMAFALPWLALRWRTFLRNRLTLCAAIAGTILSAVALAYTEFFSIPLSIISGIGVAVLCDVLSEAWKTRDSLQLALGLWLLIALPTFPYCHLPAKYVVVSAPAAALLLVREMATRNCKATWFILGTTVVLGVGLGIAILRADETFTNMGRRAATELIAPYVASGLQVWYIGHWGYQWYAENAGARPVTLTPPYPAQNDLIVMSHETALSEPVLNMVSSRYPYLTPVTHFEDYQPGGRIMNESIGVGFFSNVFGYWPWVWSNTRIDRFTVLRVD